MRKSTWIIAALGPAFVAAPLLAQEPANPLTDSAKGTYEYVKTNITKAAEQVSEANYAFKPTPEVRSFGQLIGHIADANYGICAAASGATKPEGSVEKSKTTKADLQKALGESFAFCDKAFDGMTDKKGVEMVPFFGGSRPRLGILSFNTAHDFEHYGNIVTYMRMKGMVPPSSQKRSN